MGGVERLANGGADRVAVDCGHRNFQTQRRQQPNRIQTGAHHGGVELVCCVFACHANCDPGAWCHLRDSGVEQKVDAHSLRLVFQQQGKLAAVAHFVVRQINGAKKCRVRIECSLDLARLHRVDLFESHTGIAQHLQTRLHSFAVSLGPQQHHVAVAALVFQLQIGCDVVQPLAAVKRQALQVGPVGQVGVKFAGAKPLPDPDQLAT